MQNEGQICGNARQNARTKTARLSHFSALMRSECRVFVVQDSGSEQLEIEGAGERVEAGGERFLERGRRREERGFRREE